MKRTLVPALFFGLLLACSKEEPSRVESPPAELCDGRTDLTLGDIDGPACEQAYRVLGASDQRADFRICTEYTFDSVLASEHAPCSQEQLLGFCVDVDPRDASLVKLVYHYLDPESVLDACDDLELRALSCLNRAANTWCNAGKHRVRVEVASSGEGTTSGLPPSEVDTDMQRTSAPLGSDPGAGNHTSSPSTTSAGSSDAGSSDAGSSEALASNTSSLEALSSGASSSDALPSDAGPSTLFSTDAVSSAASSSIASTVDADAEVSRDSGAPVDASIDQ